MYRNFIRPATPSERVQQRETELDNCGSVDEAFGRGCGHVALVRENPLSGSDWRTRERGCSKGGAVHGESYSVARGEVSESSRPTWLTKAQREHERERKGTKGNERERKGTKGNERERASSLITISRWVSSGDSPQPVVAIGSRWVNVLI